MDKNIRFTKEQVEQHCTETDCYVIYDNGVYDLTEFVQKHPGGAKPIIKNAGKDITAILPTIKVHTNHWVNVLAYLHDYQVGVLENSSQ